MQSPLLELVIILSLIKRTKKLIQKIFFGAVSFNNANFSLGIDFNNFQINSYGLINNTINLSYIYRVRLFNEMYFLPSLSVGVGFNQIENPDLIFGDQLNLLTVPLQHLQVIHYLLIN